MATRISREKAGQAWCTPSTSSKVMDAELAEAFAEILDDIWSRPWLGNATTGELLDEIKARVDCSYRTVGPKECYCSFCTREYPTEEEASACDCDGAAEERMRERLRD